MTEEEFGEMDPEAVEKIVEKMKKKYTEQGTAFSTEEEVQQVKKLTGQTTTLKLQSEEELMDSPLPLIRQLGRIYLKLRNPLKLLTKFISTLPPAKTLNFYLYSANIRYSLRQYLALTTSVTTLSFVAGLVFGLLVSFIIRINPLGSLIIGVMMAIMFGLFAAFLMLLYPQGKAYQRGKEATSELPFALRHIAAELKSGIGLYRTIQIIAAADYGVLSEEFARTITEIEEGTAAQEALKNMAIRVQSVSLRNALMHVVRALKTGGELSEVINSIAEDVAIEQLNQIREFAEKMNFFGVLFIFSAIVIPAMMVTMGGIRAAPLPLDIQIPVTPTTLAIMFFAILPAILGILIIYLRSAQPR